MQPVLNTELFLTVWFDQATDIEWFGGPLFWCKRGSSTYKNGVGSVNSNTQPHWTHVSEYDLSARNLLIRRCHRDCCATQTPWNRWKRSPEFGGVHVWRPSRPRPPHRSSQTLVESQFRRSRSFELRRRDRMRSREWVGGTRWLGRGWVVVGRVGGQGRRRVGET